jgi:single-strand DNA-binding protein
MSNNLVVLTGRLGQDVQLRYTGSGKAVTDISLAVSSGFGDTKKTEWFICTLWGGLAERAQKTLAKGSQVTITGRLAVEEYVNKDQVKVTKYKVVANSLGYGEDKTPAAPKEPVDDTDIPF